MSWKKRTGPLTELRKTQRFQDLRTEILNESPICTVCEQRRSKDLLIVNFTAAMQVKKDGYKAACHECWTERVIETTKKQKEKRRAERGLPDTIQSNIVYPATLHHLPVNRPAHIMPWD